MNNDQLLNILKSLSEGIDPDSKNILSNNHILNRPSVIRALCKALVALEEIGFNREYKWTITEESMLLKYYYSGFDVTYIAHEMGKASESIILKLVELDLIDDLKVA